MKIQTATLLVVMSSAAKAELIPFVYPANWTVSKPTEVKPGGTFRDFAFTSFKTFNPFVAAENPSIPSFICNSTGLFKPTITGFNGQGDLYIPYMAQRYEVSANKLVWTFDLRQGMKWSDGQEITADDFVTTAKIYQDKNVNSNLYDLFYLNDKPIRFEKISTYKLRVTFPSANVNAQSVLTLCVWPDHIFGAAYRQGGAAQIKNLWTADTAPNQIVNAGPWLIESYRPGERLILKKNPFFGEWNKDSAKSSLPYLDNYSVVIVQNSNNALTQFLVGNIDTLRPNTPDELSQIKKAIDGGQLKATFKTNIGPAASNLWIVFNWNLASDQRKQTLFRDERFRRAMSHIANRKAMVDLAYAGLASPAYSGVYAIFKPWISQNLPKYEYDLEAARKLLAELGYKNKNNDGYLIDSKGQVLEFELSTAAGLTELDQIGNIFVTEAKRVGVKVTFRPLDFNSLVTNLLSSGNDRKFQAMLLAYSGGSLVFPVLENGIPCGAANHAYNRPGEGKCQLFPWETQLEVLMERGRAQFDTQKRIEIAKQIQNIEALYQPYIYLVSPNYHQAWNSRLRGEYPANLMNALFGDRDSVLTWISP